MIVHRQCAELAVQMVLQCRSAGAPDAAVCDVQILCAVQLSISAEMDVQCECAEMMMQNSYAVQHIPIRQQYCSDILQ